MAIDVSTRHSRRSILAGALGGVAAAVAATVAGAHQALAATDDGKVIHVGDSYTNITTATLLEQASGSPYEDVLGISSHTGGLTAEGNTYGVFGSANTRAGYGIWGQGPYVAVRGDSEQTGVTHGSGVGVYGTSAADDGAGVDGRSPNVGVHGKSAGTGVFGEGTSGGDGVRGSSTGGGTGVLANSDTGRALVAVASASSGTTVGAMGESFSKAGTGVRGWASGGGTGVYGFSGGVFPSGKPPAKTGVYGDAPNGRGVVAAGGAAQLRLIPSAASSHPASGLLGDLFLDKSGRLWFCSQGGSLAIWKQIALV
jgi:hypothetical protein